MTLATDTLVKPDMIAVIKRTHISNDIEGFLLPILEAISNALHSIEAKFHDTKVKDGMIEIIFKNSNDPKKIEISITDNGIGLTEENYNSFKTPFSGYKLETKGRGFGRFIAFKVFSKVLYHSDYEFMGAIYHREFIFDIYQDNEFIFSDKNMKLCSTGLKVVYNNPLTIWSDLILKLKPSDVSETIASHFLPYFLYKWLPKITIKFDDETPEDLSKHFKENFSAPEKGSLKIAISNQSVDVEYSLNKIAKTKKFTSHCLVFTAADRIVGIPRDLTNILGKPYFVDENNDKYIIVGVVNSDIFEQRLNDSRTSIDLLPKDIDTIVKAIAEIIQNKEKKQIDKIKSHQTNELSDVLLQNPILRLGLRGKTKEEYVGLKPNNWTKEQFVADLAIERSRASFDLTKKIASISDDENEYIKNIKKIVSQVDNNNKEALAEYIIHRKQVIELVETAQKFSKDGKHPPEDVIHDIIFKRFTDNAQLDYFEHNLWLIDDALAFTPYITSDRTAKGGKRKKGDKVPDLVFFDDSLILGDNDGTTVTIIEFKKPSRNDFSIGNQKSDPVTQVLQTLELIVNEGGITRTDGTHMSFTGVVRKFGYIIADITDSLVRILRHHDFINDKNPKIWIRYRNTEKIIIQVFGYDTLVENAKKRNQAFFSILFDND